MERTAAHDGPALSFYLALQDQTQDQKPRNLVDHVSIISNPSDGRKLCYFKIDNFNVSYHQQHIPHSVIR